MSDGPRGFQDLFSAGAGRYATSRPRYPDALFDFLATLPPDRALAWDCATGNGQAATGLARVFETVVATDASTGQLRHASAHPRVSYHAATAEDSAIRGGTIRLTTVAQALHWLDHDRFYAEVRRVTVPGGIVAAWSYGACSAGEDVEPLLRRFEHGTLGPYWNPRRRWVDEGYRTVPFPFPELATPHFELRVAWSLSQLGEYLRSWSAAATYREVHGVDPVEPLLLDIIKHWGSPERVRVITWPLGIRVGRVG